jgi:hypothetical protein
MDSYQNLPYLRLRHLDLVQSKILDTTRWIETHSPHPNPLSEKNLPKSI